jgi:mono/diheme cytochrome c family protein
MKYSIIALFIPVILMSCAGQNAETGDSTADGAGDNPYAAGEKIYTSMCISCHQKNGEGVVGAFPPLANSDYLLADVNRSIDIVKNGMQGEIVVNGQTYNGIMANQGLTDEEVRDVTNYILNAWGNKGGEVSLDEVKTALK